MSATLLPGISVSNPRYSGLSLVHPNISQQQSIWRPTSYTELRCISNLVFTLGVYRSTGISVSDKVYKDLSARLFPVVTGSNPGYNSLSPGMFLSILCRWTIFTGLQFRWQAAVHRVTDWYTWEQCSLQVFIYFVADRLQTTIPQVTD